MNDPKSSEPTAASNGPSRPVRRVLNALLAASFLFNASALFLPFMRLREGIVSEHYSLVTSVQMLWSSGLYLLAGLVAAFSIVFPFAKLAVLALVCVSPAPSIRLKSWLAWVERLGKWSMLDVFLACLILGLTSNQFFVGTQPLIGLLLFVVAIAFNMLAGEILAHHWLGPAQLPEPPAAYAGWRGAVTISLSGLTLLLALATPFLRIDDWLLADRDYSIASLVLTLLDNRAFASALVIAAFLLLSPLASWAASCRLWWHSRRQNPPARFNPRLARQLAIVRRWSMLDVFGLALAIFIVEGDHLMNTEVRWGSLFLVGLLLTQWLSQSLLDRNVLASFSK